jgi:dihydrodipicolinate synthase/N-acetylneuraminate lyase
MAAPPCIAAAAVTPCNRGFEIDFGAGFELIDFLCRSGIGAIALFTSVGEYAALSPGERSRFLALAVRRSRTPIYAGIGAATLDGAIALARDARDSGATALLLPPPHGFAYTQDDIFEFYFQFAAQAEGGADVYLTQSPGLCSAIEPATASALIAAGFAGEAGFLSAPACAVPELAVAHCRAVRTGHAEEGARIAALLAEFTGWTYEFPPPVAIKTALGLRGIKTGPLANPLTAQEQRRLEEFRAWFSGWLPQAKKLTAHA